MTQPSPSSHPADICLLLRAYAEQLFLARQVVPVLQQLEHADAIPDDQLGAALAYLELLSLDASQRAIETEAAFADLLASDAAGERLMHVEARQYYAAVTAMRDGVERRVASVTAPAHADAHTDCHPHIPARARLLPRRSHTLRSPHAS
jgi:hypothetical protein